MKQAINFPEGGEMHGKFVILESYHVRQYGFCNLWSTDIASDSLQKCKFNAEIS